MQSNSSVKITLHIPANIHQAMIALAGRRRQRTSSQYQQAASLLAEARNAVGDPALVEAFIRTSLAWLGGWQSPVLYQLRVEPTVHAELRESAERVNRTIDDIYTAAAALHLAFRDAINTPGILRGAMSDWIELRNGDKRRDE